MRHRKKDKKGEEIEEEEVEDDDEEKDEAEEEIEAEEEEEEEECVNCLRSYGMLDKRKTIMCHQMRSSEEQEAKTVR